MSASRLPSAFFVPDGYSGHVKHRGESAVCAARGHWRKIWSVGTKCQVSQEANDVERQHLPSPIVRQFDDTCSVLKIGRCESWRRTDQQVASRSQ